MASTVEHWAYFCQIEAVVEGKEGKLKAKEKMEVGWLVGRKEKQKGNRAFMVEKEGAGEI